MIFLRTAGVVAIATISIVLQAAGWQVRVFGAEEPTHPELQISDLIAPSLLAQDLGTVTSVEDLADVSPTDWPYAALQRLVEQYGCLSGYPDDTFRGDRSLSRYEFAAVLQTCLGAVTEQLAELEIPEEELATVQRLRDSFRQELTALDSRLGELEADTAVLEGNVFAPLTKLRGDVTFSLDQPIGDEQANGSGNDLPETLTLSSRVRLNFDTSFTGRDLLKLRLDLLDPALFNAPVTGTNMTRLAFDIDTNNQVSIGKLFYRFPLGDRLRLHVDATNGAYQANVSSTFNPSFADPVSGAVSRFGRFNPIYYQGALGAGVTGIYDLSDRLKLSAGYLSRGSSPTDASVGVFGGGYTALAQLEFSPTDQISAGLAYARSYYPAGEVAVSAGTSSRLANAPFGNQTATAANHFGVQSSARLGRRAILSGWAGFSQASALEDNGAVNEGDDARLLNWAVSLGLPNLGRKGNFGGLLIGQPFRVLSNDGGADEDDAALHLEAFYRHQVSPNVSLIPGLLVVRNPENNRDRDSIWIGSLRSVLRF